MDAIWGRGLNDTESGNMGIRFLSRAVNENHLPKEDTVHTVDGAAQIAVAGGVQGMAVAAADGPGSGDSGSRVAFTYDHHA